MNSLNTLAVLYLFFTLSTSAIIYAAFQKKLDASAQYFLVAELLMSIVAIILFLQNSDVVFTTPVWLATANLCTIGSEFAILFSIKSLVKYQPVKRFYLTLFLALIFVIIFEVLRNIYGSKIVVLLFSIVVGGISLSTFLFCTYRVGNELTQNKFMRFFRFFELGLFTIFIVRCASAFSNAPIIPRNDPSLIVVLVFALYMVFSVFRYMSYIGLRMTWVDPQNLAINPLNRELAKALEDKDQLLRGLIASNRVIGISALASSLAHQLSQPLTAISLQAERSQREIAKSGDNPLLASSLNEISNQLGRLSELVQNLRQLFSSSSTEFSPFNLQKICNEILSVVEPTLQSKKITLVQDFANDPTVYGDPIQIQQVLINVFNNAIDVISHSNLPVKKIRLSIGQNDSCAILCIEDSGVGIDPLVLPFIFELYKTTKQGGLGVGLWLSKTIMDRHHGSITAKNTAQGGAVFEIQIPLAKSIA